MLHSIVAMFTFVASIASCSTLGELTFQTSLATLLQQLLLMSHSFGRWPKQVSNSVGSCEVLLISMVSERSTR